MPFEITGEITDIETIAVGGSIRILPLLRGRYGPGRWRKKGGCDGSLIWWYDPSCRDTLVRGARYWQEESGL